MTASEAIGRLQSLNIDQIAVESIAETKDALVKLNEDQWSVGIRNDGLPITPEPYSKAYAKLRKKEGLQTDFIDLKRKGNLYKGVGVDLIDARKVKLSSSVPYEKWVSKRYDKIWGLDPENLRVYQVQTLMPVVREKVSAQTGLGFK